MRRKKTSRSAALAASANARAAVAEAANGEHHHDNEGGGEQSKQKQKQPPGHHRARTLLAVGLSVLAFRWFVRRSNRGGSGLPSASDFPELPVMNNLTSSLQSSTGMLQSAFDDFYAANVQPYLDDFTSAFNGTRHEAEEESRVGYQLRQKGARVKYPVVMIPGFVTSGLELWEGTSCAKKHFRQRLWGSTSMARTFFADRECWRRHLALDPLTGMDPVNVRLRSAQGFEAADNFIATYWVWSKMIENLADVGYDGTSMTMMSYDWRLGYEYLEERDGYFTRLKHVIESHRETSGEKVMLISHSMGGTVAYYFLQWVVADAKAGGGGGGKRWVEDHVHAFVNVAGTMLGVPKAIPALLSGELKDTAVLLSQLGELLEQYFGRRWRRNLWITWGSLYGMLPKGGDAIWGVETDVIEDDESSESETDVKDGTVALQKTLGKKASAPDIVPAIVWNNGTEKICPSSSSLTENTTPTEPSVNDEGFTHAGLKIPPSRMWTMGETIDYLFQNVSEGSSVHSSIFSPDAKAGWKKRASSKGKRKHWSDPIASPLPRAPSLKLYCLYGTGLPTERSYYYKVSCDNLGGTSSIGHDETCLEDSQSESQCKNSTGRVNHTGEREPVEVARKEEEPPVAPFLIDTAPRDDIKNIHSGVRFSDGDGSVPLVSLGYMCRKWSQPRNRHNPSGIKVFTREKKHEAQPSVSDPGRGGPISGEHVDILGNVGAIEDVVRIATGFEVKEKVDQDVIVSDLERIVQVIDEHRLGGSNSVFR